jgi:hypothetical protein
MRTPEWGFSGHSANHSTDFQQRQAGQGDKYVFSQQAITKDFIPAGGKYSESNDG